MLFLLDCFLLDASRKVAHKTGEILQNKIADAVTKSNSDKIEKKEPVEGSLFH